MRDRKFRTPGFRPSARLHPLVAVIVIAVMPALAVPAVAADQETKGWYVALDLALTQPNSLDQHFADRLDFSTGTPTTSRLVLENDSDATYRAAFGYSFGKGLGSLQVSYWGFDNDDSQAGPIPGDVSPTVFGIGYYNSPYYGIYSSYLVDPAVTATSSVEATALDVDYVRPMPVGEKVTINWLAGLRAATYEEDQGFVGNDGGGDYIQGKHFESDSAGFRVGATARLGFTRGFALQAGAAVSFLQADTEGTAFQSFPGGARESRQASDDNVFGTVWDFDLTAQWSARDFDYYVGYSASIWDGLVIDPNPPFTAGFFGIPLSGGRGRDSIGFNNLHAGFVWRFGGG